MTVNIIQVNQAELWTETQGDGIPLLLCNGGPGLPDYLSDVANMVSDQLQVIRWEQRGCGRSTGKAPFTIEQTLADMEAIRQFYGFSQWLVGGHSWGADLTVIYALEYGEHMLGGICIAGGRMNNDRQWHAAYKAGSAKGELLPKFDSHNDIVNKQLSDDRKQYIQDPFLLQDIATLETPIVFIYGDADIRPSWAVEQVAYLLPNGDYREIGGAPHSIWMTHPYALKAAMREFIGQFKAASA